MTDQEKRIKALELRVEKLEQKLSSVLIPAFYVTMSGPR